MRKILKKTATLMMTAVIGVSMSCPKIIVYAGQRMQMQERYTTPKEWNYTEITAYQFGSTDKFEDYLQTGGTHLYNDCLLYTSPSPRDPKTSRMPSSA